MKKLFTGVLIGAMLMFSLNVFAEVIFQESKFTLFVNGNKIEQPMYMKDWVNYIPLRAATEALGATVDVKDYRIDITMPTPEPPLTDVEAVAKKCKDSCVMIYAYSKVPEGTKQSQGSGFAYNGYIVTAKHVVEGAQTIDIFTDDKPYGIKATIHYADPEYDVAILKADTGLPSVTLGNSDELREGEKLIAITSPGGLQNCIDECLFSGITQYVDGTRLTISESGMDAGSSGGAVFNNKGEIVGLVFSGLDETTSAISINDIKPILEKNF